MSEFDIVETTAAETEEGLNGKVYDGLRAINREKAAVRTAMFDIMKTRIKSIRDKHTNDTLKQQIYIMDYLSAIVAGNKGVWSGGQYRHDNMEENLWRTCAIEQMKAYRYYE